MKYLKTLSNALAFDIQNFKFCAVLIFVGGIIFAISYRQSCANFLSLFIIIFGALLILYSLDYSSFRAYIYCAQLVFLLGILYVIFYHKYFLQNNYFHQKLYVQARGKIIETRFFSNPQNHMRGVNLKIRISDLSKLELNKNPPNKTLKKSLTKKIKKTRPKKTSKHRKKSSSKKISKPKKTKRELALARRVYKKFINVSNYQELDRKFLDTKNNIYFDEWLEVDGKKILKNVPHILSLSFSTNNLNSYNFAINDEIAFQALINLVDKPDFIQNFNPEFDAFAKNIDGFGYIISSPDLIAKSVVSDFDSWFLNWREIIRYKIYQHLTHDEASLALALLIGEQNNISKNLLTAIRNTGLSHLLSISGFHLSLACAIFFVGFRAFLARFEILALKFDIKKISAVLAILASFSYFKIANAPIPSQRALIVVWMAMISLLIDRRFDALRALFLALFLLAIINPYNLYQVSFQLSFMGVLITLCYVSRWRLAIFPHLNLPAEDKFITGILSTSKQYFLDIFIITAIIQIACLPILMNNFQSFSLIAFLANLIAIPLVSFLIMPCAFLALILIIFGLEKLPLLALEKLIEIFIACVNFFIKFPYSSITTPYLSSFSALMCILAVIFFCLSKNLIWRVLAVFLFVLAIFFGIKNHPTNLILEKDQKFYAIFDQKKLFFSTKIKQTKQIKNWLKAFGDKDIRVIQKCNKILLNNAHNCQKCYKNYCEIFFKDRKILVLTNRVKITKICHKIQSQKFHAIVNLTKKYQLPDCIKKISGETKIIDNFDFLEQKTIFVD